MTMIPEEKRRSSWHSSVEKPWKFKIDSKNGQIEKEITFFQLTALKSSPPNLLDNGSQTWKTRCDRGVSEFISHLAPGTYVKFNCSPPDKGSTCPKNETKVWKHHFSGPFAVHLRGSFFRQKRAWFSEKGWEVKDRNDSPLREISWKLVGTWRKWRNNLHLSPHPGCQSPPGWLPF